MRGEGFFSQGEGKADCLVYMMQAFIRWKGEVRLIFILNGGKHKKKG